MSSLKPCPFCGGPNVSLVRVGNSPFIDRFAAHCWSCKAQGMSFLSREDEEIVGAFEDAQEQWRQEAKKDAIEAWNDLRRRPIEWGDQ